MSYIVLQYLPEVCGKWQDLKDNRFELSEDSHISEVVNGVYRRIGVIPVGLHILKCGYRDGARLFAWDMDEGLREIKGVGAEKTQSLDEGTIESLRSERDMLLLNMRQREDRIRSLSKEVRKLREAAASALRLFENPGAL